MNDKKTTLIKELLEVKVNERNIFNCVEQGFRKGSNDIHIYYKPMKRVDIIKQIQEKFETEIKFNNNEKKKTSVYKIIGDEINYSRNIAKRLQGKVKSKE